MNGKLVSGSVLTGVGVLAAVLNAWAQHFFFAMFHIAAAQSLAHRGSFSPGPYGNDPTAVGIFVGVRVVVWVAILAGLALLAWGVREEWAAS